MATLNSILQELWLGKKQATSLITFGLIIEFIQIGTSGQVLYFVVKDENGLLLMKLFFRVYCKYHYLEGHETENPEMEIWTFLVGLSKNEVDVDKQQYTEQEDEKESKFNIESE